MRTLGALVMAVALLTGSAVAVTGQERDEPATTDELLATLVTEEVEPGVWRVISDGVRDLSSARPGTSPAGRWGIVAGDDGSMWLRRNKWLVQLGDEERHELPIHKSKHGSSHPRDVEFAPDGTVWAITDRLGDGRGLLRSYDGERWRLRSPKRGVDVTDVEVGPDGTVWASWAKTSLKDRSGKTLVGTVGPDGLERVAMMDGDPARESLTITHDGDPMLLGWPGGGPVGVIRASRYTNGSWQVVAMDGLGISALGPDGSVWVLPTPGQEAQVDANGVMYEVDPLETLVRIDGEEQQVWGPDDGMTGLASGYKLAGAMRVAPDGSLWVSYPLLSPVASGDRFDETEYDGIARFDGTAWQRYLRGHVVWHMDIAPDGTVWLQAGQQIEEGCCWPDSYDWFVIRPEAAVPAAE